MNARCVTCGNEEGHFSGCYQARPRASAEAVSVLDDVLAHLPPFLRTPTTAELEWAATVIGDATRDAREEGMAVYVAKLREVEQAIDDLDERCRRAIAFREGSRKPADRETCESWIHDTVSGSLDILTSELDESAEDES